MYLTQKKPKYVPNCNIEKAFQNQKFTVWALYTFWISCTNVIFLGFLGSTSWISGSERSPRLVPDGLSHHLSSRRLLWQQLQIFVQEMSNRTVKWSTMMMTALKNNFPKKESDCRVMTTRLAGKGGEGR